jgi:Fic family protein
MEKASFWDHFNAAQLNDRQIKVLNRLFDGFEGNLTTTKWAKLTKCSQDTAYRDILALVEVGALRADGAGRNTHYVLVPFSWIQSKKVSTPVDKRSSY